MIQEANATLTVREDVADSVASFRFRLDRLPATYRPGQYISLGVATEASFTQRAYSIVRLDESDAELELFIRRVEAGSLTPQLWQLPIGARVRIGPPKGLFVLDEGDRRTRVFVGTGTGLAPLLAMLDTLAHAGDRSPNVLVHGVAYQTELGYREKIERWVSDGLDLWYIPSVSRPQEPSNSGWGGTSGRADAVLERVFDADPSLCGGVAYLCGNPSMIGATTSVLIAAGMRAEDVRSERFQPM